MTCGVPGCEQRLKARGFCDPHYRRFLKYGDPLAGRTANGAVIRFLDEVTNYTADECLAWPFAQLPSGHGLVHVDGRKQVASRIICERAYGPPPSPAYDAAHSCANGNCINPRHLRWATRRENQMDRLKDGTSNRGERHGKAKLTAEQVREIRTLFHLTDRAIADRYGVKREAIREIRFGRNWSWLT